MFGAQYLINLNLYIYIYIYIYYIYICILYIYIYLYIYITVYVRKDGITGTISNHKPFQNRYVYEIF